MFCMKAEIPPTAAETRLTSRRSLEPATRRMGRVGEHRIAGQSCQGLVCLDQAEPGQSQHDAQRHHVHAQPLFDEEEDGDAEDDKGEDDLGGHGAPEMCRWFFVSVLL
jgi:hypothetical protein